MVRIARFVSVISAVVVVVPALGLLGCGPDGAGQGREPVPFVPGDDGRGDGASEGEDDGGANEGEGEGANEGANEGEGEAVERVCLDVVFAAGGLGGFELLNELALAAEQPPAGEPGTAIVSSGGDPALSLPVSFDLGDCSRVELTFAVDAGDAGQLFWWREGDGWYAEERSRFFAIVADGASHVVTLELGDHPLWTGSLHGLRLDPTNAAATVRLERVRVTGPATSGSGGDGGEGEDDGAGGEEGEGEPPGSCEAGFVVAGARCVPAGPAALTQRTEAAVCARWNAAVFPQSEWNPTPDSTDTCDEGVVPQEALDAAIGRVNLYRYLAGVGETGLAPELFEQQQACATLMSAYGSLTHQPTPDMPCYSGDAAAGAGSSNIAYGAGLLGSIDLYMSDFGAGNAQSLGHRRWTIGPFMSHTQFGVKNSFSCMYTFGVGQGEDPGFVSWPPAGYVPSASAPGDWSYESIEKRPVAGQTTVELSVDDGPFAAVEYRFLVGGYGRYGEAIAWSPPGGVYEAWQAGRKVQVRLRGTSGGDVQYTVKMTDCAAF